MALPEPPEENRAFKKYELPTWAIYVSGGGLLLVTLCVSYTLQVEPSIGVVPFIVAAMFGLLGSIFAHETVHYKTAEILGYDPTYEWPTHVYVPDVHLPRGELNTADELFFTGSAAEVTPIRQVDNVTIGNGSCGPVTKELQSAFFDLVERRTDGHDEWFTYVDMDV